MRKRSVFHLLVWGISLSLLVPSMASAIDVYGRIRGIVTDPSGAVIAGATVTATNTGTGISVTTKSATDGSYEFLQLPAPATYDLKCEQAGFKSYVASKIPLAVTQIYVQNISMVLGQIAQQVTVEAAATQVESTSIQLQLSVGANQIVEMPLNGRNWVQLQQTLPGVVAASDGRGNFATNGSQTDHNSFLVNGVDINDLPLNTPLLLPSPDAIAEFNMVTNSMNPEYGRNSGAILNATLKSGGNSFHGSGFDFFRDTGLNARNFFSPKSAVFHQHQFGGTVGGPVWRDHTFFFFSYQGARNRVPQAGGNVKVLTQNQRDGIFPGIATSTKLSPFPLTGEPTSPVCPNTVCPAGTAYDQIFPTGNIPAADFDSISTNLLKTYVPLPNFNGTNYTFNPTRTGVDDQFITRIDHNFSTNDTIWGTWYWERNPTSDVLPFSGSNLPGFPATNQRHYHQYVLTWNHTFSATSMNEARIGYTRFNFRSVTPVNIVDPASLGFTGIKDQNPAFNNVPVIALTGYFTIGFSTNGPQPRIDQTYQFDDNYSYILGKHTFKAGFNMRRFQVYQGFYARANGSFSFSKSSNRYTTGDPGADFLLGIPRSYNQSGSDIQNVRAQDYYGYFQDQFRVKPNLTLTYGFGWAIDTPLIDNYHDNHAMVAFRPGQQSTVWPNAPTGYVFEGDAGVHASGETKWGHIGPRIGFAWSPGGAGKWSVRGGYGIYFNRSLEEQMLQMVLDPPYSLSSNGVADVSTAANPRVPSFADPWTDIADPAFTIPNKFPTPANPPQSVSFAGSVPLSISVIDPKISVPYAQNYNLTVERQLPGNTIFAMAFVGAQGRKLLITRELNPGNQAKCAADPACAVDGYGQNVDFPNNFPYPGDIFGSVGQIESTGISNYNSFQTSLNKRMGHGVQALFAYTWSHSMDDGSGFENSGFGGGGFGGFGYLRGSNPFNRRLYDYGPSIFDARHRFVVSYIYEIPTPHYENWAVKRAIEGWRLTGITTFQTGFPMDVIDSNFLSLTCAGYTFYACPDVPNAIAPPKYLDPKKDANHQWFDTNTFAVENAGTFGNAGRNLLRGPGIANFDFALHKDTKITERTRLEMRFEFFNLFNHTQFTPSGSDTDIASGTFGEIFSARDPRLIQLAAKFYF